MKNILILGAGKSAAAMITYLLEKAATAQWHIVVADKDVESAEQRTNGYANAIGMRLDIKDLFLVGEEFSRADVVVSFLPADLQPLVATHCLKYRTHLVTTAEMTSELNAFNLQAHTKGLLFLHEAGMSPGLDDMQLKSMIEQLENEGGTLFSVESYTGELLATPSKRSPWEFKQMTNIVDLVNAGRSGAGIIEQGQYKHIPYHRVFASAEPFELPEYGPVDLCVNKDVFVGEEKFDDSTLSTLVKGRFYPLGFCRAWDVLLRLGLTADDFLLPYSEKMTYRQYVNHFLRYDPFLSVEEKICRDFKLDMDGEIMLKLRWLGLFDEVHIGLEKASPAKVLEHLLEHKWKAGQDERDVAVQYHRLGYRKNKQVYYKTALLNYRGNTADYTAMSMLNGWPAAIAVALLMNGKLKIRGVHSPLVKEIYEPVLLELKDYGVAFHEFITPTENPSA